MSRVKPLTRDIAEVRIKLAEPVSYTAGQYARLKLGDVEDSRAYSFANAPADAGDETVVFHVRRIDGGEVSPKLTTDAAVGMELEVQAPLGDFGLADGDHRMLCIAGGSGMAPLKSILEQVINDGKERTAVYLYGARTQADLYPPDVMASIQRRWPGTLTFVPVLSEEPQSSAWSGARGMVTEYITAQPGFNPEHCHAYLCGPPPMIDAAIGVLESHGMPEAAIHFDKFTDRRHVLGHDND